MKRKEINYKWARELIYTKDRYLQNYIDDMMIKLNQMFHYENLPESVPKRVLEKMLMESGYCIFTKIDNKYVVLQGGLGGELNEYYEYTKCIVANPYLNLNKEFVLGSDCVLIRNDSRMKGLLETLSRYGVLCGDCEISLNMITNVLRSQFLISASDNKTKESADIFIKKLLDGEFVAVGENGFFDGVKVHTMQNTGNYIHQFIELNQYLKATSFNEIGLNANYNMKRERLSENEIDLNNDILLPLAEDMLESRKNAVNEINKKYNLNISVELSSVWKMQKETMDKATATENTETEKEDMETRTQTETETETQTETETETQTETETEKEGV